MSAELIFSRDPLLSGNLCPATGTPFDIGRTSTNTLLTYGSGQNLSVTYYCPTPFNGGIFGSIPGNPDYPIYTQTLGNLTGFAPPVTLTGAFARIYAISNGTGQVWAALEKRS